MTKLSAIQALKQDLDLKHKQMAECIDENGFLKQPYKYDYNIYIREAKNIKDSIDYLEALEIKIRTQSQGSFL